MSRADPKTKVATKFTPGPWSYSPCKVHTRGWDGFQICFTDEDGDELIVAEFEATHSGVEADARLMAAAPDLYEALRRMVGLIQLIRGRADLPRELRPILDELHPARSHRITDALAALSKAEGAAQ